jgi:hypothetical protein
MILHEKSGFIGTVNRQYDDNFAKKGAKIGSQLQIRLPNQFTVRTGKTLATQDTVETSTTLTMATQKGVDTTFSSVELTLNLDDFAERILEPAMSVLAANIQYDVISGVTKDVYNAVGTPGTAISKIDPFLLARAKLNQCLTPKDNNRFAMISSPTSASMVAGMTNWLNPSKSISSQFLEGSMGHAAGFDFMECDMVAALTTGTRTNTTPVVASSTASTVSITGLTPAAGTIKAGDVFTMAGVYAIHPETKQALSSLQQFVVTADVTAAAGAATIAFAPSIAATGAYQNVSAAPAASAAVVFFDLSGTHEQNLAYHKDAFTFVSADLEMPEGVHWSAMETFEGITMRIVRAYDINTDNFPCRLDVLYGYKSVRPQFACRVTN